jgi:predicted PurR-regulated permease PerM
MLNFQQIGQFLGNKEVIHKIIAYSLLILCIYFLQGFLFLFFLTFVFAYLFLSGGEFLKKNIDYILKKRCKNDTT